MDVAITDPWGDTEWTKAVEPCGHCGENHFIIFEPIVNPIVEDGRTFNWAGKCETTGEWVWLSVSDEDDPRNFLKKDGGESKVYLDKDLSRFAEGPDAS